MPSPGEVRRKASNVNSVNDEFCRWKDRSQNYAYNSSSWWQGDAGKILRSEYSDVQADISKLLTKMNRLESLINSLSSKIQQADDERRRRAEEQERLALAAKRNSRSSIYLNNGERG